GWGWARPGRGRRGAGRVAGGAHGFVGVAGLPAYAAGVTVAPGMPGPGTVAAVPGPGSGRGFQAFFRRPRVGAGGRQSVISDSVMPVVSRNSARSSRRWSAGVSP